ncbi:low temperature requirement protein A [Micromonospora sp. WMMD1102]|uniref:low temperature requirement protein A n=1 Tax=Micromonospora sp. WMMD1102 TaxID=3016105 RepID=UPI00241561D3|nr:low temperature requirement protein A [Micromonospora sp. WMMD1102]MDG4787373.1 low temperature requirement protein A [Micromonospora sp. WMMD1102]
MRPQQPNDRAVTWEELFFDLAFVFALTRLAHLLHDDHGWAGSGKVLILFVVVYWIWGGTGFYTDRQSVGMPSGRIVILTLGFAGLLLGITVPDAYGDRGLLFVSVALTARILLGIVTLRGVPLWRGFLLTPHGMIVVTAPLLLMGALTEGTTRIVLWAVAVLVDVSSPLLVRGTVATIRVQARHYAHRYGLFIIIVLGESVIQVGTVSVDHPLTPVRLLALAAGYALAAALWWTYFGYGVHEFRLALERAGNQARLRRSVLINGHLLFSFAIIAIADGLADVAVGPLETLSGGEMTRLVGGCALFLGTFAYTHWRIHREIAWRRLAVAAGCLVVLPLTAALPSLAALGVLLLLVGGLAALEETFRRRHPARAGDAGSEQMDPGPVTNG